MTASPVYQASPIKRTRATKAEVEARREALLDIIEAGRPMTVRQVFYQATVRWLGRVLINPPSVSAAQSMSASLRKRPKCCVAAKRRYVPNAVQQMTPADAMRRRSSAIAAGGTPRPRGAQLQ